MQCNDAIKNPGESEGAAKAATEKESSLSRHSLLTAGEKKEAIELAMGKTKPEKIMEVSLSSKEVLKKFREEGCVHKMKEKQRRPGPAWSHVALNAGALGETNCAVRAGFKNIATTEIDKKLKEMAFDFTGSKSLGDTFAQDFSKHHAPAMVSATVQCIDYSSGSPKVGTEKQHGVDGDSGWQFVMVAEPVLQLRPLIIEMEMVGNAVKVHESREFLFICTAITRQPYELVAALVRMQSYGDIINKERVILVANHKAMGKVAAEYRIPTGNFSDAVSFCAKDVIDEKPDEARRRQYPDHPVRIRTTKPGELQLAARCGKGQGFSNRLNASYAVDGLLPATTTYAGGRHLPEGWKPGDDVTKSFTYSPEECGRAANLAESWLEYYRSFEDTEQFQFKCMAMGYSQRFGVAMAESHIRTLVEAGVPYDVTSTATREVSTKRGKVKAVKHEFMPENEWMKVREMPKSKRKRTFDEKEMKLESKLAAMAVERKDLTEEMDKENFETMPMQQQMAVIKRAAESGERRAAYFEVDECEICRAAYRIGVQNRNHGGLQRAVFDTGAQVILLQTETVGQYAVKGEGTDDVVIVPAAKGAEFKPDINGTMGMKFPGKSPVTMTVPVLTASRTVMNKNLMAYEPYYKKQFQLDIRTKEATRAGHGHSKMWRVDDEGKPTGEEIPLHRDEEGERFWVHFIPARNADADHVELMNVEEKRTVETLAMQGEENRQEAQPMQPHEARLMLFALEREAFVKEIIVNSNQQEAKTSTAVLPEGKKLDIILARHPEDHCSKGVKCNMEKSKFKKMKQQTFAKHLMHTGCGPDCPICRQASGAMRTIFKIVDKYQETRSGFFWSLDTQVLSHRSRRGFKYYTTMRCLASKYIIRFKHAKKDDIYVLFEDKVKELREDPIYKNYNWQMVGVIKCDNPGEWRRDNKKWIELTERTHVRMWYTSHDRFEDTAEAESTVNISSVAGKKGMMMRNADEEEWDLFWDHGLFLLNRTIAVSGIAERSPDGDQARPIEIFTHGFYSRARCNRELAYSVVPHTPMLVHDPKVSNASMQSKVVWMYAEEMFMDQVICRSPFNDLSVRKTKSFDAIEMADGIGYRDFFKVSGRKKTQAQRPIVEDFTTKVTVHLPPRKAMPVELARWKMPSHATMVKHVINGDRIPGVVVQKRDESEAPSVTFLDNEDEEEIAEPSQRSSIKAFEDTGVLKAPTVEEEDEEGLAASVTKRQRTMPNAGKKATRLQASMEEDKRPESEDSTKEHLGAAALDSSEDEDEKDVNGGEGFDEFGDAMVMLEGIDDDILERAEAAQSKAEGFRVTKDNTRVGSAMEKIGVKPAMLELYKQWVTTMPNTSISAEEFPKPGDRYVKNGLLFPKPKGTRWWQLQKEFYRKQGLEINAANLLNLESARPTHNKAKAEEHKESRKLEMYAIDQGRDVAMAIQQATRATKHWAKQAMAVRSESRSKDHAIEGVLPPPKNYTKMWDHPELEGWLKALAAELCALTDIGAVTHGHTRNELREMGIEGEPVPTQCVFENKFKPAAHAGKSKGEIMAEIRGSMPNEKEEEVKRKVHEALQLIEFMSDGRVTTQVTFDKKKVRIVVTGTERFLEKGTHYNDKFAATPSMDANRLLSALTVAFQLLRKAFDVKNAFCWAKQRVKMALKYPYGMPQFNGKGEQVFMALWKNTYGKADGSRLWELERNQFWMEKMNENGFTCKRPLKEQAMFYITLPMEKCDLPELKIRINAEARVNPVLANALAQGRPVRTWMICHTDDAKMAGESDAIMSYILEESHKKWTVKEVDPGYMLGVQQLLTIKNGVWKIEHKMPLYIDGMMAAWHTWLEIAGWIGRDGKIIRPDTPSPVKTTLTLHDPENMLSDEEVANVTKRGYLNVVGGIGWAAMNCYPECVFGHGNMTTVMSRPSEKAWKFAMHMLAWLCAEKDRGIVFSSDRDVTPMATVDASLDPDLRDGKVRAGHIVQMSGGPVCFASNKIQKVAFSIPGAEYMQQRTCGVDIVWLRSLLQEIGLGEIVKQRTEMHGDNTAAIDWAKFGKITVANKHIALSYHEQREWVEDGFMWPMKTPTKVNNADQMTKPPTKQTAERFVRWTAGYEEAPAEFEEARKKAQEDLRAHLRFETDELCEDKYK